MIKTAAWLVTIPLLNPLIAIANAAEMYVGEWETFSLEVNDGTTQKDPFKHNIAATFIAGTNAKTVKAFYDGDGKYVVRTYLEDRGDWSYRIISEENSEELSSGTVHVSESDAKGAVRVNDIHQAFQYADGSPYTPLAFEMDWLFALDENNSSLTQTSSILNAVKDNGFNQVIFNVYAFGKLKNSGWSFEGINEKYNFNGKGGYPFGGDNNNPDHSAINIDYFKRLDKKIALLDSMDIQAHMMIYVWNKSVNWPEPDSVDDQRYFDYVVTRYAGYKNIIWDIAKEALDYGRADLEFINGKIARLRELDNDGSLITVHDYTYSESESLVGNIDFVSIQEWAPDIGAKTKDLLERHPLKPVHNIENGCYEVTGNAIFTGTYSRSETCLDRNYKIYFNGGFVTHYWQNAAWFELNYEPMKAPNPPDLAFYKTMSAFTEAFPLTDWRPRRFHFTTWSLSKDKDMVFYLEAPTNAVRGHLPASYKKEKYKVSWISTLTGERMDGKDVDMRGYVWLDVVKPDALTGEPAIAILESIQGEQE